MLTKSGRAYYYFRFDLDGEREVNVAARDYRRFMQGDPIYIELAKNSGLVLRIEHA